MPLVEPLLPIVPSALLSPWQPRRCLPALSSYLFGILYVNGGLY